MSNTSALKDKEYLLWWDSLANEYESKVLSPLYKGVKNPVFEFVTGVNSQVYKKAADIGCGSGELLVFLSEHFEEVWGLDWSRNMLRIARERLRGRKNVRLQRIDIRNLASFYDYFDIAFSINTIAPYDISVAKLMIREVFRSVRDGGLFIGVFPSFDTVLYQRGLTQASYVEQGLDSVKAWEKTDEYFIKRNKMDISKGTYAEDGIHTQKFYSESELRFLLQDAGFRDIATQKVLYPWELSRKYGYGYFPNQPEIWDWFCSSHK